MRTSAAGVLGVVLGGLALSCHSTDRDPVSALSAGGFSASHSAAGSAALVRWDIIAFNAAGAITPGGSASATAADELTIILTGSGTFVAPGVGDGTSSAVTGGGTWAIGSASGTYRVTGLVRWDRAPASLGAGVPDLIADPATSTAGLAVLRVQYSDGSRGTLTVSCKIGVSGVFEGVTASKGFVDFWNRVTSPTLFHVSG